MDQAMAESIEQWALFIKHARRTRLDHTQFGSFAVQLNRQNPLPSIRICDLILRPYDEVGVGAADSLDPRVPAYLAQILLLGLIDASSCLRALKNYTSWTTANETTEQQQRKRWKKSYHGDETVILALTKHIAANDEVPKSERDAINLVRAATEWAVLLTTSINEQMAPGVDGINDDQHLPSDRIALRIAYGMLVLGIAENALVVKTLRTGCPQRLIKEFSDALALFAPTMTDSTQAGISERIELFRTQILLPLQPVDKKRQAENDEINQLLETTMGLGIDSIPVVDLPVQTTRAGLYVYLSALLVGRPLIDDDAIFNYLHNRYQGNAGLICTELITASFDVLANAIFRKESSETRIVLRSFLVNKVPLLLSFYSSSMFAPITPELCITQALSTVDTNAFPTFSSMFDESSTGAMFGDSVRQEFCFACCLHGLLPEDSIERLLGEIPMQTLPAGGRYNKDQLVQQCISDSDRAESLLSEIEHMEGNTGAVSQAIIEVIGQLCRSRESISLKTLCTHLVRKPTSIDIMLLFDKPTTILQPLCELLDNWHIDEDLGEHQPVYEQFGGILLLVMTIVYRYNLSPTDLGTQSNGFVSKWLLNGTLSSDINNLSPEQKKYLDVWIKNLFNSEGGGLGDEPMSACPPQEFYLLVPTLFQQIVLALSTHHLDEESLKGGLEFLVDTFLLPSLVGGMIWLAHRLWESNGDSDAVLTILQSLVQPTSIGGDASAMLACVLNIVAKPLEQSLRSLQRSEPSRQDIAPLSKALAPHLSFYRTGASAHTELEGWTSTPGGGIVVSITNTMQQLIQWSSTQGLNIMPTSYTHRQMLVAHKMLGATRIVDTIIAKVKEQTLAGSGAVALDVAMAIVCAPDSSSKPFQNFDATGSSPQVRMSLPEALAMAAESALKTQKDDVAKAEAIIRLHRRVGAQNMNASGRGLGMPNAQNAMLGDMGGVVNMDGLQGSMGMTGAMGTGTAEIDDAIAAANAAGGDLLGMGAMSSIGLDDDALLGMNF